MPQGGLPVLEAHETVSGQRGQRLPERLFESRGYSESLSCSALAREHYEIDFHNRPLALHRSVVPRENIPEMEIRGHCTARRRIENRCSDLRYNIGICQKMRPDRDLEAGDGVILNTHAEIS